MHRQATEWLESDVSKKNSYDKMIKDDRF